MTEQTYPTPALDVIREAFARVRDGLPDQVRGRSSDDLLWRPAPDANPVAWLVWHLARVQDDHLAGVAKGVGHPVEEAWPQWEERFGLPYDSGSIGYGQSSEEVGEFSVGDAELLLGYLAAVHERTEEVLGSMSDEDLATVVDTFDGEDVTAQARLVSVIGDITQHQGQIGYVLGLLEQR